MKILHIMKTAPDGLTKELMDILSKGEEATAVELYGEAAEYEKLIDLIFEADQVVSWW